MRTGGWLITTALALLVAAAHAADSAAPNVSAAAGVRKAVSALLLTAPEYTLHELGPLVREVGGLNETGALAATCAPAGAAAHPCVWQRASVQMLRVLPGYTVGQAFALNDRGEAAGICAAPATGLPRSRACLWRSGKPIDLGSLTARDSIAYAIGDDGAVYGGSGIATDRSPAWVWRGGRMRDLHAPGALRANAVAVNAANEVVGAATTNVGESFTWHAVMWRGGRCTRLAPPPVRAANLVGSFATAINARGVIAGWSWAIGSGTPWVITARGATKLPRLGRAPYAVPHAINASGVIVGESGDMPGEIAIDPARVRLAGRAAVWRGGRVYDLNTLAGNPPGWVLIRAVAIDDAGRIAGEGTLNGAVRCFMLEPTRKRTG